MYEFIEDHLQAIAKGALSALGAFVTRQILNNSTTNARNEPSEHRRTKKT